MDRKAYPSDISDEEWALVAPYLTLMTEDAPQRDFPLREVFNGLRYIVRTGAPWRWMPHDLPPWHVVYQQSQRWIKAGVFESLAHDLRAVLRIADGRKESPTTAIIDSRTLQSTPESGARAGYDGAKRRKGSKVHLAVDTLGHLLALCVTAADEQDRAQVSELAKRVQAETGETVEIAYVDQGYTGETQPMRPESMESSSKSSNYQRRREDLSSYHADGWWSEVSAGCHAFAAWRGIMSACRKPWPDCITWPSSF
jgi:transposase